MLNICLTLVYIFLIEFPIEASPFESGSKCVYKYTSSMKHSFFENEIYQPSQWNKHTFTAASFNTPKHFDNLAI